MEEPRAPFWWKIPGVDFVGENEFLQAGSLLGVTGASS
jgi:hypothetical protein